MAIRNVEPDRERVSILCLRLREVLELALLRDPSLNERAIEEIRAIRKELKEMGFRVDWTASIADIKTNPRVTVDVSVFISANTTA